MFLRPLLLALVTTFQAASPAVFQSPYSVAEMRGKQVVVETTNGTFVVQLLPEAAPVHAAFFMQMAERGSYVGTIFHQVTPLKLVQGGDPLSRNPNATANYGRGGFNILRAERSNERHMAGAVSTVRARGRADSGGWQFIVAVTNQPKLDNQYTVFGRVVEGLEIVEQISMLDTGDNGMPKARSTILKTTVRDTPPVPFADASEAELSTYRAVVETSMGDITLDFLPGIAPETVRAFLQWAQAGVYDGILIPRVEDDFVIQTGELIDRAAPLTQVQRRLIRNLPPEFSPVPHRAGTVSIARTEDPLSGRTSFFICTGLCRQLDEQYTLFATVSEGMDVVRAITRVPKDGTKPRTPLWMKTVRVEKK
jgi:peptidylprolyl isomerase